MPATDPSTGRGRSESRFEPAAMVPAIVVDQAVIAHAFGEGPDADVATAKDAAAPRRSLRRWIHRGKLRTTLLIVACLFGRPTPGAFALGAALLLIGIALHLWSKGTLVQKKQLTTSGPYRWCRNPFYLANLFVDFGIAATTGLWWIAAGLAPLWWLAYSRTIAREEAFLSATFGEAFAAYRARVPRLIPWRRPAPAASDGPRFSWRNDNLIKGQEYARLTRIVTAPVLVLVASLVRKGHYADLARITSLDVAILVLLVGSEVVHRALIRRFDRGLHLMPAWLHTRWASLGISVGLATLLFACRALEWEHDSFVYPAGLAAAGLLGAWMVQGRNWSLAKRRASEALIFAVGGWLAELPWLGVAAALLYSVFALDLVDLAQARPGSPRETPDPAHVGRPAFALCSLVALVALALIKEALTPGL